MAWLALIGAGLFELVGVNGFQHLSERRYGQGLLLMAVGFGFGLFCLHFATQVVSLTLAYALFTAIGLLGSVAMGVLFWNERLSAARVFWMATVVLAILGLKMTSG